MRSHLLELRIRDRIALTIFAVATSLLVVMSVAVYIAFDHQLRMSLDSSLRIMAESNRNFVDFSDPTPVLYVSGDPGLQRSEGVSILRLYDTAGALISDASPAAGTGSGELAAVQNVASHQRALFITVDLGGDEGFRLLVTPLSAAGAFKGVLVSGVEITRVTGPMQLLRISLIVAVPVTSLLLGLGGYWIARRALRSVSDMTSAADQITSSNLMLRIPMPPSQDELGHLAGTLNSMIGRLGETMERERRFTSDASHELRTPLTSIETSIDVTLSQERPIAEYQRVLGMVRGQTRRLHALTRQLLLLSRLDANQVRAEFVSVELNGFLEAIVEAFREAHPDATVTFLPSAGPLEIRGEMELLARAFMNVLENAAVHAGPAVAITIETSATRGAAAVAIEDNGPGAPESLGNEIFQRFRRGYEARQAAGSGLGLAIVEAIALVHDGEVRLVAPRGARGARFEFTFKLASSPIV